MSATKRSMSEYYGYKNQLDGKPASGRSNYRSPHKPSGKLKEVARSKRKALEVKDLKNIPIIKQVDNARLIPKYASILSKTGEDMVVMDDLDQLQRDLEKLLSTNAIRKRFLFGEVKPPELGSTDVASKDNASLKRKRVDEKARYKELRNGVKFKKEIYNKEIPKVSVPRNDNADKFWASIDPYCNPVTKDDLAFMQNLLSEFSKDVDTSIPELGEHYATSWSEEILNDEKALGKSPTKKPAIMEYKKSGLHTMVESFATPQTQRLLSALIEERALKHSNGNIRNGVSPMKKIKASDLTKLKKGIGYKIGTCLDKRLQNKLLEQGIITQEDIAKSQPDDEILREIKKCQEELSTVNQYNVEELTKLKSVVYNDLLANDLKRDLKKIDKQCMDIYHEIMASRKAIQEKLKEEGQTFDETIFAEDISEEYKYQAHALLKQQAILNREADYLTSNSKIY